MRSSDISKPVRGLGASPRSRRPVTAIWYQSCTSSGDSCAARPATSAASASTAMPGTICCSWMRCSAVARSSSTWLKSGENEASSSMQAISAAPSPDASADSSAPTCERSTVPSIAFTAAVSSWPPVYAMAWSSRDRPSRRLPSAARASSAMAPASAGIASASRMRPIWPPIWASSSRRRLNCRQRESTVTGSFCGSVVASRNFTCSGGSSRVLSSALKAALDSMCTSSIR